MRINCVGKSASALLKTPSDEGRIEELELCNYVVEHEDYHAPPLVFSKLKSLNMHFTSLEFLKFVTKSQMTMLTSLKMLLENVSIEEQDILSVLNSKKALNSLQLQCFLLIDIHQYSLLHEIVKVLKTESDRPFLKLQINGFMDSLKIREQMVNI